VSKENVITVFGIVGRDAEIKEVPDVGHIASFPLAVYRSGKGDSKKTDWFKVEAWHDLARGAFACCKKGRRFLVRGFMKLESKQVDGAWQNYVSLVADRIGEDISVSAEQEEEIPF
jgi:single-stranded DNA-binding protein